MAFQKVPFCTDEELARELEKLGYQDVPPDIFQVMKNDLLQLIDKESSIYNIQPESVSHRKYNLTIETSLSTDSKENFQERNPTETSISPRSFIEYKNRYKLYKMHRENRSLSNDSSGSISDSSVNSGVKMKRKILRRINGKPIISEELLDIPGVFNTSYPVTESTESFNHVENSKECDNSVDNATPISQKIMDSRSCTISKCTTSLKNNSNSGPLPTKNKGNNYKESGTSVKNFNRVVSLPENSTNCPPLAINSKSNDCFKKITKISAQLPNSKSHSSSKNHTISVKENFKPLNVQNPSLNVNSLEDKTQSKVSNLASTNSSDILELLSSKRSDLSTDHQTIPISSSQITNNSSSIFPSSSITSVSLNNSNKTSTMLNHRFSRSPPLNRKKKNDPVTMYNYYKKFWREFKPPGEKTHDKLRWAVRDRMLDYSL